jgi:hypothetical protein
VIRRLKAGIVEPEVAWIQLGRHVHAARDKQATIEELLETMFSMWSVPKLYTEDKVVNRSRYQATTSEDIAHWENLECAVVVGTACRTVKVK